MTSLNSSDNSSQSDQTPSPDAESTYSDLASPLSSLELSNMPLLDAGRTYVIRTAESGKSMFLLSKIIDAILNITRQPQN